MRHALVIVNPRARRGRAARTYERIRREVEADFRVRHTLLDASGEWLDAIHRARLDGIDRVVAVGGDGTVHAVANALLADGIEAARDVQLGAIGVGSSNDFHKPPRSRVCGAPARLGAPVRHDAGLATWEDARGVQHARWFLVSASLGISARANRRFSRDRGVARWLGARSVHAAIAHAAIGALVSHESVRGRLREESGGEHRPVDVSNLGVMLTPYLAGVFRYDADVPRPPGTFALHLCDGMTRLQLLGAMADLSRGRFAASPETKSWASRDIEVELDNEADLELDGELFRARAVRFRAFSDAIAVCA